MFCNSTNKFEHPNNLHNYIYLNIIKLMSDLCLQEENGFAKIIVSKNLARYKFESKIILLDYKNNYV